MKIRQERFGHAPVSDLALGVYIHTAEDIRKTQNLMCFVPELRRNEAKSYLGNT
jgi:hypothetical protein